MAATKKRSREHFDADNDDKEQIPVSKKSRLNSNIHHTDTTGFSCIEMHDCTIVYSALDPIINASGVHRWEAVLMHTDWSDMCSFKSAVLAKASFSVMELDNLSNFRDNLREIEDWEEKECFHHAVFIDSVDVHPDFSGYEYELCLVQRIIDSHARTTTNGVIIVEYTDSMQIICQKMNFEECRDSRYRLRFEQKIQPNMNEFKCFRSDFPQQPITSDIEKHYEERDETDEFYDYEAMKKNDSEKIYECKDMDLSSCYVSFSSTQNATNTKLEMDFTSSWTAKLEYRPPKGAPTVILAVANFWCIQTGRLFTKGWYDELPYVLDAPSQALADLIPVMADDAWDGVFKVYKEDNIKSLRIRCKSTLIDMMSNPKKLGKEYPDEDAAIQDLVSFKPFHYGTYYQEMNECGGGDVVYVDRVWVDKDYGGRKFGRCLVQIIINNHARGYDGVVLKPFPLQWEGKAGKTEEENKEFEKDKNKLVSVWESMWFCPFGGPNSPYWGRSEALSHPKMEIEGNKITFEEM